MTRVIEFQQPDTRVSRAVGVNGYIVWLGRGDLLESGNHKEIVSADELTTDEANAAAKNLRKAAKSLISSADWLESLSAIGH